MSGPAHPAAPPSATCDICARGAGWGGFGGAMFGAAFIVLSIRLSGGPPFRPGAIIVFTGEIAALVVLAAVIGSVLGFVEGVLAAIVIGLSRGWIDGSWARARLAAGLSAGLAPAVLTLFATTDGARLDFIGFAAVAMMYGGFTGPAVRWSSAERRGRWATGGGVG